MAEPEARALITVIDLWPLQVSCGRCGAVGMWRAHCEWYEDGPMPGSGFYVWLCPPCDEELRRG